MSMKNQVLIVELRLFEHARTDRAVLVSETGDSRTAVWLPLSQIEVHSTGDHGIHDVCLPEWLAIDKGLI
jgi:hypothetical protein